MVLRSSTAASRMDFQSTWAHTNTSSGVAAQAAAHNNTAPA